MKHCCRDTFKAHGSLVLCKYMLSLLELFRRSLVDLGDLLQVS